VSRNIQACNFALIISFLFFTVKNYVYERKFYVDFQYVCTRLEEFSGEGRFASNSRPTVYLLNILCVKHRTFVAVYSKILMVLGENMLTQCADRTKQALIGSIINLADRWICHH
jgi:hypothetical protein